jgi:hypothetical protein
LKLSFLLGPQFSKRGVDLVEGLVQGPQRRRTGLRWVLPRKVAVLEGQGKVGQGLLTAHQVTGQVHDQQEQ